MRRLPRSVLQALLPVGEPEGRRRLAVGITSTLELCPRGAVHLRVGRTELRLTLEQITELRALFELCDDMLDALCEVSDPTTNGLGDN